jgi:tetratricopeptide (TPR) repeat protein
VRHTIILFTVLLLAACDSGERQRLQLEELERMNCADSVMLNDSLARDLADWFDRHGTRNEQLRAYYMLGRTYADRGEAPQAIIAYNDAINSADTTNTDCDYKILCRVYAQMATVLYHQDLYRDGLEKVNRAVYYGFLAKDTLAALMAYTQKLDFYDMLQQPDSMLFASTDVYEKLRQVGYNSYAAEMLIGPIRYLTDIGDLQKARELMNRYESETGFFDAEGNICKGREVFYYHKGLYYLKACQYDSAEYCFRKELSEGKDFNNQNAGAYGLTMLFQQTHRPDSAAKYAIYSYAMNDSVYSRMSTQTVARMQAMYDYSHHQQVAQQEKERADRERMHFWSLVFYVVGSIIALSILAAIVFAALLHQRKKALKHYYIKVEELKAAQQELRQLLQRSSESEMLISKKEQEIQRLQSELDITMKNRQLKRDKVKFQMEESGIGQLLRRKAASGTKLTEEEWARINLFISESMPEFDAFLSSKAEILGIQWMRICILFRLFVIEKNVGTMLGVSAPFISSECKKINSKLFFVEGSGKVLARELLKI